MNTCTVHGALLPPDVIKAGKNSAGVQRYKCKICHRIVKRNYYFRNKERLSEKQKRYRRDFPQKNRDLQRARKAKQKKAAKIPSRIENPESDLKMFRAKSRLINAIISMNEIMRRAKKR